MQFNIQNLKNENNCQKKNYTTCYIYPQLFIFASSLFFLHLGHLLIFLLFEQPPRFFVSLILFLQLFPSKLLVPQGDTFLLCMAVKKWKYSLVILVSGANGCNPQSLYYHFRDSDCFDSQSDWCLIVSLLIHNPTLSIIMYRNAYRFMVILLECCPQVLSCVLLEEGAKIWRLIIICL